MGNSHILKHKIYVPAVIFLSLTALLRLSGQKAFSYDINNNLTWWKFQSIDTMKYSRDLAREKLGDSSFDDVINAQVKAIADAGATHVAVATPYDEEFYPFLRRWVKAARENNLNVWFRGNFSGWEGWFDYPKLSREEHLKKTSEFIMQNKDLFEDGDIFTACPECENGGPGDPRQTGDIEGTRRFYIQEYAATQTAFFKMNKAVLSNFNSMNADVAKIVMDKKTTQQMGGIVTIDHYVSSPQKLADDIVAIAKNSGGNVVLGEFGAPIPDLNGNMSPEEQASWIKDVMDKIANIESLYGVSYWTNVGSSTQIWNDNGSARPAVEVLKKYFIPETVQIYVKDETGKNIDQAAAYINTNTYLANGKGVVKIPYIKLNTLVQIKADGYSDQETSMDRLKKDPNIVMILHKETLSYKIKKLWSEIINAFKAMILVK